MSKIYYKTDFSIEEHRDEDYTKPFVLKYSCVGGITGMIYFAKYDGEEYHNCTYNEESKTLEVHFKDHNMGSGKLTCEQMFQEVNDDGTYTWTEAKKYDDYKIELFAGPIVVEGTVDGEGLVHIDNVKGDVPVGTRTVVLSGNFHVDVENDKVIIK